MLRDPELIRTILIKDFSHFHDRTTASYNEKVDPLSVHLNNLCGKRWKDVRSKLTPAFSSGKLRDMQNLMNGCISELADYLRDVTSGESMDSVIQDVRDLMPKFATDVIGACVFGLNCHTVRDGDSEFRRIGRLAAGQSPSRSIHNWLRMINPKLIDIFNVKSIDPEVEKFFKSVLSDAIECSQSNTWRRNDFLQLLINIQAEEKKKLQSVGYQQNGIESGDQNEHIRHSLGEQKEILFTDNVVASNAFLFFFAGFATVALTLSYCLYELALNQEICGKLKDEVEKVKRNHGGNLDYDAIKELVYMEAVLSGIRFARYEMKACLAHIVSSYTIHPCEKTVIPLKYNPRSVLQVPLGGVWVRFQRRSKL